MIAPKRARPGPGDIVGGKYRVERALGEGGMGYVLAARHVDLGHRVALKLLREERAADDEVVERFLREARAAAQLGSEHVARVTDVGRGATPFFVMEYLEGCDAAALLATGPLSVSDAVGLMVQACHGLAEAHRAGIVHRDIKPHNLFVTRRRDGSPCVKVLDFGIARHQVGHGKLTQTATIIGSPPYMSPEQMTGAAVDARSDVWSAGATLHELLTGHCPFPGGSLAEIYARVIAGPPEDLRALRPDVPEGLAVVIARCLSRAPAERWPDAAALADALAPYTDGAVLVSSGLAERVEQIGATTRVVTQPTAPRRRARAWIVGGVVAGGVALVGGIVAWKARTAAATGTATATATATAATAAAAMTAATTATAATPTQTSTTTPAPTPTPTPTPTHRAVTSRATASARPSADPFGQRTW